MALDTGFPRADAENDFLRVRRNQVLSRLAAFLRRDTQDVVQSLSFDEVVDALGRREERFLGVRVVSLDRIVGSVDKVREFDHRFRPTSGRHRERWERMALAARRGESFPPIDLYKLGDLYFVRDGHHRVSVARAQGLKSIEAFVTEVNTILTPEGISKRADLEMKQFRRLFLERVPLDPVRRATIAVHDPWMYARLAEAVEAWGARLMHWTGEYFDRATIAKRWYDEEFTKIIELAHAADLILDDETEAEAYQRITGERYRLIRQHAWSKDIAASLRKKKK